MFNTVTKAWQLWHVDTSLCMFVFTGSLSGGKSTSPMGYGGSSGYTSAYQSSYKSAAMTTSSGYTSHPGSGLTSLSPNNLQSKSQYGSSSYQSSSYPAQTGSTATNSGQMYPSEASSFQSQTSASSYPSHAPAAFSSSSAGYQHQGAGSSYGNQSGSSYQNQSNSYQRDASSYHSRGDGQSAYSGGNQSNSAYQSDGGQSAGAGYPSSGNQTSGSTYQRDSQFGNHHQAAVAAAYNSSSHTANSTMSSADKLSDSLSKMAVNDLGVEGHQTSSGTSVYSKNSTVSASLTTTTTTTSSSMASGNVSVSSSLGLTTASSSLSTSAASSTTSTAKSSLPLSSMYQLSVCDETHKPGSLYCTRMSDIYHNVVSQVIECICSPDYIITILSKYDYQVTHNTQPTSEQTKYLVLV